MSDRIQLICNTGGAIGSDMFFEEVCLKNNILVRAYSFHNHSTKSKNRLILTRAELLEGYNSVKKAAKNLKRSMPYETYILNLILRNYHQLNNSNHVYAIGTILEHECVDGGTGWAVQMAVDKGLKIFVFDQDKDSWYAWDYQSWIKISKPPKPDKFFTGIGTRQLEENGKKAIENLIESFKQD